jgi:hypothetical protein
MSAVIAIRNAIPNLQAKDIEEVVILMYKLKSHHMSLITAQKTYKQRTTKRETILDKIHKIDPSFQVGSQSDEELKDYLDKTKNAIVIQAKSDKKRNNLIDKIQKIKPSFLDECQSEEELNDYLAKTKHAVALQAKADKKQDTLMKKFHDKFPTEMCPSDMTNEELDSYIKTKLQEEREAKAEEKKFHAQKHRDTERFNKIANEISGPIPEGISIEDLKQLLKEQKNENAKCEKFRTIFDDIVKKNPEAGISPVSFTATSSELQLAIKNARDKKNTKKNADIELEKKINSQKRADKKIEAERKKLADKSLKQKNKENGIKGSPKNPYFQAFAKHITQQINEGIIDQCEVTEAGGKSKFQQKYWSDLNDEQKKDSNSEWYPYLSTA